MHRTILAVAAVAVVAAPGRADETVTIDGPTRAAIDKALVYLKAEQARDGSWGQQDPAITAFALLAFMANGHVPGPAGYGPEVARGVRFLVAVARDDGYLAGPNGGNNHGMYCHGMATLVLSQAFGMSPDPEVRRVLKKAVELIVKCQNREGGWRYQPQPNDADISATIMQVMALRGAKDSGLSVADDVIKKAVAYINKCQETGSGGYRYQPFSGGAGFARTAAGVCVLQLAGDYDAKPVGRGVEFLDRNQNDGGHYWYGHYYAAHAYHQVGGKKWAAYYGRMKTRLLSTQGRAGEWATPDEGGAGAARVVYQTAIGVLVLSVPANYLPIYQR